MIYVYKGSANFAITQIYTFFFDIIRKKCTFATQNRLIQSFATFMNWSAIWHNLRKWLLNKYVITCILFAVVLTFIGEQSLVNRARRAAQIRVLKQERAEYQRQSEQYRHDIDLLEHNTDSLERFARVHYYMHADGEDVYLIEE